MANQTSGYPDFETDPTWTAAFNNDPFHIFRLPGAVELRLRPTGGVCSGDQLELCPYQLHDPGQDPVHDRQGPPCHAAPAKGARTLGLTQTAAERTAYIPAPCSTRSAPNVVWRSGSRPAPLLRGVDVLECVGGTPDGAAETTDIYDMAKTAADVGTGSLLSKSSYHAMADPNLSGFGQKQANCVPSCFTQVVGYDWPRRGALGIVDPAEPSARRL